MRFVKSLLLGVLLAMTASAIHAADTNSNQTGTVYTNPTLATSRLGVPLINELVIGSGATAIRVTLDEPTAPGATEGKSFYRCNDGYDPPCRKVATLGQASVVETENWAELIAASRAARTGLPTPIVFPGDDGPIAACANTHGASACCRRIGDVNDGTGDYIIQCG